MEELVRTTDPVLIASLEALLTGAGVNYFIADTHMSILDGSLSIIPRRILVDGDDIAIARQLIIEAGLEKELRQI